MVEASHSPVIKDSGERRVFATGANRDRVDGKGAFHLLPFHGLERVCRIFEVGGKKYTPNNWRLGMNVSEYYNSALRHAVKAANGWNDEDHPAMAAWNMLCAMETQWMCEQGFLPKELNDIQNFLTAEGVQAAFEEIRLTNKKRLEELAAVKESLTATTVVQQ